MADDGGETTPYEWFLYLCRRIVHWGSFFVAGLGTLLIFWFHWGNAYAEYGVKWFDADTAGKCTGTSLPTYAAKKCLPLVLGKCSTTAATPLAAAYCDKDTTTWCGVKATGTATGVAAKNGGWDCGPLSDNNKDWRKIFTFKPNAFLDMFTPITLGAIETIQHLGPTYSNAMISGTWIVRAIWLFALSLFGQFGYAGDLGVLCGYIVDFAVVLPCIALAILDHESDEAGLSVTTADVLPTLKWLLTKCGLEGLCPGLTAVKARTITKDNDSGPTEEQASA